MNAEINAPIGRASKKGLQTLFGISTSVILRCIASHLLHRRLYEISRIVCGQQNAIFSLFLFLCSPSELAVVKTESWGNSVDCQVGQRIMQLHCFLPGIKAK